MKQKIWITKEGKRISWDKLTPEHKKNIEAMIARNKLQDAGQHDDWGVRD